MTQSVFDAFYVSSSLDLEELSKAVKAPYHLQLTAEETQPYQILDTFDQQIHGQRKILFSQGNRLLLLDWAKSLSDHQQAKKWAFVEELNAESLRQELGYVSSLRALLPVQTLKGRLINGSLLDDEQKTVARIICLCFETAPGKLLTLTGLNKIRGYGKAFKLLAELFSHPAEDDLTAFAGTWALLVPDFLPYTNKPQVDYLSQSPAYEVASRLIAAYLHTARLNEEGVCADFDSEFLHDYRISLRKVRSILSLFKGVFDEDVTCDLKTRFSDLMRQTNRLRDLDVYLLEQESYLALVPEILRSGLLTMFEEFAEERDRTQKKVKRQFLSKNYKQEMTALQKLCPHTPAQMKKAAAETLKVGSDGDLPVFDYASALIWKRYRKVRKLARRIDAETPDEQVHELRIQFKKMRYLMEFFAPLYSAKEMKTLIKSLRRLQNSLGKFNDCSVQQEALNAHITAHANSKQDNDLEMVKSVGALVAAIHQSQLEERIKIVANLDSFTSDETSTKFEHLFHLQPANSAQLAEKNV